MRSRSCVSRRAPFDLVFLDPPYAQPLDPLLELLPRWLSAPSVGVRRAAAKRRLPAVPGAEWSKQSHAGAVEYGFSCAFE